MSHQYQLAFDVVSHGYTSWWIALAPGSIAIVAAAGALLLRRLGVAVDTVQTRRFRYLLTTIAVMAAIGTGVLTYLGWDEYARLRSALERGAVRVVTGPVSAFVPEGPGGHPQESFRVNGDAYRYSSYDLTSAFHHTAREGGPIRDGLSVRIADVDGAIVRLEVTR